MSKLFEAIQRGKGELSEVILSCIDSQVVGISAPIVESANGEGHRPALLKNDRAAQPTPELRYRTARLSPAASILMFSAGQDRAGEQCRILRTKILQHPAHPRVLLVSSTVAADGKTTAAINLTAALSLKGKDDVLLVDADFRRPSVAQQLGMALTPGIADVLKGSCRLEDAIVRAEQFPSMCLLPAGESAQNPAELLDSSGWLLLSDRIRQTFRYVVIDSPPISAVADYDLLQNIADGVIIIVRQDHTPRKPLFQAIERVPQEKLIGLVLNCVPKSFLFKSSGHDYYNYYRNTNWEKGGGAPSNPSDESSAKI